MRLTLVAGTTRTARIDGISAAGADPDVMVHTPSADAEILAYGDTAGAPVVPVSPSGCPTPAVVTRAAREALGFEVTVLDAGLARPTAAPTVDLDASPGGDVREAEPVPDAAAIWDRAHALGAGLPDEAVLVGETIPGGTTTALGVFRALGVDAPVSSSLPANPTTLKQETVAEGLAASGLEAGDLADDPRAAARRMGDPVLAAVAGFTTGAVEGNKAVTLAGGTQLVAAAALVRAAGVTAPLTLATTSFVAQDVPALDAVAETLALDLTVTDPGFEADHVGMERYLAGEGKEGVGMGGALALADEADALPAVRHRMRTVYDRVVPDA